MKKISLLALIALLPILCMAEVVSEQEALTIATKFMNAPTINNAGARINRAPRQLSRINQQVVPNQNFYIFNSADGNGYVVVSADDVARPILGYSDNGNIDVSTMPENMRWWLGEYNAQIEWAKANNLPQSAEIADEWRKVESRIDIVRIVVSPLLTTTWGQGAYYNDNCPLNLLGENFHTETGCVATAMAQVMKYWEWPIQGYGSYSYECPWYGEQSVNFGSTTYNWSLMPNSLSSSSSSAQVQAVAKLMYHCGVAIDMDYGYSSSGTDGAKTAPRVKSFFRYHPQTRCLKKANFTNAEWINVLKSQLDASYPMIYVGMDSNGNGGHAFVCDGYDDENLFHINWGWNGASNGFYLINALNPDTYHFNNDHQVIVNMIPNNQTLVSTVEFTPIVVRIKKPSNWGNTISAWVWETGGAGGKWVSLTKNGEWYEYTGLTDELNIIFVNGTTWSVDNNQTVNITTTTSACYQIGSNTSGKRTYIEIDCPEERVCQSLPYTEPFSTSQGDFAIENVNLDGLNYVWTSTSNYGMKASAYVGQTNHATEAWLISPCLELPANSAITLSFDHVYRYTSHPSTQLTLMVSEDYVSGNPTASTWSQITIPTYSSGTNWTFVNSSPINLNAYAGKQITLAFRYTSSAAEAPTWEIKNVSLSSTPISTSLETTNENAQTRKVLQNGQLYIILPDGTRYSATGQKVK